MQAVRRRASCIAHRSRPLPPLRTRSYASSHGKDSHHGHDAHAHPTGPVNEPMGAGFWTFVAALPAGLILYYLSQPAKDGEPPALTKWIQSMTIPNEVWAERNALHTAAIKQAADDRILFNHAPRSGHADLRSLEAFTSSAPRNVSAGSQANLDHVVEHYRKQHLDLEERKAKRLEAKKAASSSS